VQRAGSGHAIDIAEMFLRRMRAIHRAPKEELQRIQLEQRERTERLVETLDSMLDVLYSQEVHGRRPANKELVGDRKRIEVLRLSALTIRAWSKK